MTKSIGFIGLGAMGAPMLKRLAEGMNADQVFGYDLSADIAKTRCAEAGATVSASISEIGAASDILFSCVPNNDVLREVYLGDGGVASAARPGTVTIDCSTVGPDVTVEVHDGLKAKGIQHLDASMLGSVKQANEGTISFVVGGEAEALDTARPALEKVGGLVRHCGPSGAGNQMKLLHQILVAGHAVAVAETMALCEEVGADADAFFDIVTQGTGFAYSRYFENRVPRMKDGDFSPLFMLKFMLKDARLARAMTTSEGTLPALDAVIATLEAGDESGLGDDDFSAAMKVVSGRFNTAAG